MSIYYNGNNDNFESLNNENNSRSCSLNLCPPCPCNCISNLCSCVLLPLKLCMGITWIGSCGLFFYLGNLYGQDKLFDLSFDLEKKVIL